MLLSMLASLIGGLGLGALFNSMLTIYVNQRVKNRDKRYNEKKDAYLELLSALRNLNVHHTDEHLKDYALCELKCSLFGSTSVIYYLEKMKNTIPESEERNVIFNELIESMKADLLKL